MPVDGITHHAERIQSAISSNGAAKSALIASWQRSACFHKLDPARRNPPERLTDPEFRRARQEVEPLIQVAPCLVEQRALTIHRDQHFYARNALLSCTTAPLYDHEGRLVAALDVSSCKAGLIENFVNLIATAVIDAAARIEAECFRLAYSDARILVVPVPDKMGKA